MLDRRSTEARINDGNAFGCDCDRMPGRFSFPNGISNGFRAIAAVSMVLLFLSLGTLHGLADERNPVRLSALSSGKVVAQEDLASSLCREWVECRSSSATELRFWDITLELERETRLLLGANSVYIYALTLSGKCGVGRAEAPAGKIMVWNHYGSNQGKPLVHTYSATHLLDAFAAKGVADDVDLTQLAASQKRKKFWGLLRPTGFNVATPLGDEVEAVREDYQTDAFLIGIKRSSKDGREYADNTAKMFVEGLRQGDARSVALLISPKLFLEGASAAQSEELLTRQRLAFARQLLAKENYSNLDAASVTEIDTGKYLVRGAGGRSLQLSIAAFDDGLYVTSLKPQ